MELSNFYESISDYIVVEARDKKTNSGLFLSVTDNATTKELVVVATGKDVKYTKVGDNVEIADRASIIELGPKFNKYKEDGAILYQIREYNIMGKFHTLGKPRDNSVTQESMNIT